MSDRDLDYQDRFPEEWPIHLWNHLSIVLHPRKNPECAERAESAEKDKVQSTRYLTNRDKGFLFISWFHETTGRLDFEDRREHGKPPGSVGLFATVDWPHELVVIKRILGHTDRTLNYSPNGLYHPEVAFNTVQDRVRDKVNLPAHPPVFPQTYAFQVHKTETPEDTEATIFQKFYNGGTLKELLLKHRNYRGDNNGISVPEPFIWHVIAELGRAYSMLHTGEANARSDEASFFRDHKDDPDHEMNRRGMLPGRGNDQSIVHCGGSSENIWLHWPDKAERKHEARLHHRRYIRHYCPMIVLGDFGLAFEAGKASERSAEPNEDVLCHGAHPDMPERATWRDKAHLGHIIKHLILADRAGVSVNDNMHHDFLNARTGNQLTLTGNVALYGLDALYSPRLLQLAQQLEPLANLLTMTVNGQQDFWGSLRGTTAADWAAWPTNDYLYGHVVAEADHIVNSHNQDQRDNLGAEYRIPDDVAGGRNLWTNGRKDVGWTRPKESFIPVRSRERYPPETRRDCRAVWKHLEKKIDTEFADYDYPDRAPYEDRPVEIMKVWPDSIGEDFRDDPDLPGMVDPGPDDWDSARRKRKQAEDARGRQDARRAVWAEPGAATGKGIGKATKKGTGKGIGKATKTATGTATGAATGTATGKGVGKGIGKATKKGTG